MRGVVLALGAFVATLALAGSGTAGSSASTPVATAIATGYFFHSCALVDDGTAYCWGFNLGGALGDGTTVNRMTPVPVEGLSNGLKAITVGQGHSCALTAGGGVKCWGWNGSGELGNGQTADSTVPVAVSGLSSGVEAISAGWAHTCALTDVGGVKCWGSDYQGQLGDGDGGDGVYRTTPVSVRGLASGVEAIAAGGAHTCALLSNGRVKCWGWSRYGQLGDGTKVDRFSPVDVSGLSNISAISGGEGNTCALTDAGAAKCWGANQHGQVGDGTTEDRLTPVE